MEPHARPAPTLPPSPGASLNHLASLLLTCALGFANPLDEGAGTSIRYSGALRSGVRNGEGEVIKRFQLYGLMRREGEGRQMRWFLTERGAGGWSWPERFGTVQFDAEGVPTPAEPLRLMYDYNGAPTPLALPFPIVDYFGRLKPGGQWTTGKESWEVQQQVALNERPCWKVAATTGIGRRRTVWVLESAPLIASSEGNLFVGQGDEHKLTMQLEQLETLDATAVEKQLAAWARLEKLQQELARSPGEFRPELSEAQLSQVATALPELKKLAEDTPLSALVTAISADLRGQSDRSTEVTRLQSKFVGKAAPEFELTLLDRKTVKPEDLKDQVVVLHFWEYQAEPLVEPYGQIGFLDFLNDRRKKLGVKIFGVAVDERFGNAEGAAAAGKSVQRLKSFMNLGYPLAGDDGKLLKRFGDPRELNAQLPLWIVIGADGKIAHYHSGLYKIDSDEGLKELDEELIRQIRLARGKPAD